MEINLTSSVFSDVLSIFLAIGLNFYLCYDAKFFLILEESIVMKDNALF